MDFYGFQHRTFVTRHEKRVVNPFSEFYNPFIIKRKDGDSNPGNPLEVDTLSRRASSTTPAPFQYSGAKIE